MTNCNPKPIRFARCKGRLVEAAFSGGDITSDGGAVLLRQTDRMLGLTDRAAGARSDPRRKASCRHSSLSLVRQRVYALALGYEDLNDHDELRSDPALQTAVGADETLASASTLCRWETGWVGPRRFVCTKHCWSSLSGCGKNQVIGPDFLDFEEIQGIGRGNLVPADFANHGPRQALP